MTFLDLIMMAVVVRLIDLSEPSLALPLPTAIIHCAGPFITVGRPWPCEATYLSWL